jgi:hypothetical protein
MDPHAIFLLLCAAAVVGAAGLLIYAHWWGDL